MKRFIAVLIMIFFSMTVIIDAAIATERIKGLIKQIEIDTNTVVVTDERTGKDVTLIVEDKEILRKFKIGDKVSAIYETKDDKNIAKEFKKDVKKRRIGC